MTQVVDPVGGWFDPYAGTIDLGKVELHMVADEFLVQKLIRANDKLIGKQEGELISHRSLSHLAEECEMTNEEVLMSFLRACEQNDLKLTLEISTHRMLAKGLDRCPPYIKFTRVS